MANQRDVTFATINLLNLHDADGRVYGAPAFPDRAAYEARIAWLAQAVRLLQADVIGFQELWSVAALRDVFEAAGLADDYDLAARDALGPGKPQVAMAIRKGWLVGEPEWTAEFPETYRLENLREQRDAEEIVSISIAAFSRPVLKAVVRPPVRSGAKPPDIAVFVAHLKSKAPARITTDRTLPVLMEHGGIARAVVSHVRRMVEAGALRAMLDAAMRESEDAALSPTVVMGDLNDATYAVSTEVISAQPSYRLAASSRAGSRSDRGLYSVETLQQYRSDRNVYYSYIYRNKIETLDHILVSEEFYDHSEKRHWSFVEMEAFNDHLALADESDSVKKRIRNETGTIDHGIIRAEFAWDPIEEDLRRIAAKLAQG
ncbi:endonuclease/exonuclease/phosphatase family protein [Rubrimonas cliftonensis]|uniref:Endonuclease/Exonuclease/phosphatase family protein n=1 Tax=Rubrimonas cliftonensis TaxID=89524 RepID=A0A1H4ECR8_9RHOB|nr:endonuclease/exonuclease/phosphatase family protein [Rubrimonas cliftonensis]SEA82528.1 Endonuclease/Exonuclease/phosphatase family protein [Rubrimonas cliftonensis]